MKGFSLIELLTAVAILTVLVVISLPKYNQYLENSAQTAGFRTLKDIASATLACAADASFNECDTLVELGIQTRARSMTAAASKSCYIFLTNVSGNTAISCVSVDAEEGTHKIIQAGRYCHKLAPDPLDPLKRIKVQPSPPLMCRRHGTVSPDCPSAFPICQPIGRPFCINTECSRL